MSIIEEYLVKLGMQDSFTEKLTNTLRNGSEKVSGFVGRWGKNWALAGGAVVTGITVANAGLAKFLTGLVKADDELTQFARMTGRSKEEAYKTKSALDAMGKSMEEIRVNPRLYREFLELRKNAQQLKPPDMREGLGQIRGIQTEFFKLKQLGGAAIQWVGFYLLKYIEKPMGQIKGALGGINEKLAATLPVWTKNIGQSLSWIVRLGAALIRGAGEVFKAIKRIFDMIPGNVKIAMGAFAALAGFIRAGPVGKLIGILSVAMLLLEDFFTYLDGGDALLGGLWKSLLDIWNLLRDSGALDKLKEKVRAVFQFFGEKLEEARVYLAELFKKFRDSGSIEEFKTLLEKLWELAKNLAQPFLDLGAHIATALTGAGKSALDWFITTGLPKMIEFVANVTDKAADLIGWLNDMGLTEPIILGIVSAFAGLKLIDGITESVKNLTKFIEGVSSAQKAVGHIEGMKNAFGALREAINLTKVAQEAHNLLMLISAARSGGLAAAQGALATADGSATISKWAYTAAVTASNTITGIGTAVTTAFGAAMTFLTSPIGLVILAIGALIAIVVLLVKNWDKVKSFFIGLWDSIKETFSGIASWFSEKFTAAKEAVTEAFANIGEWFKEKALMILAALLIVPTKAREKFGEAVQKIKEIFTNLPETLKDVGKNLILSIWKGVMGMKSWLKEKVTGFFSNVWDGVKKFFTGGDSSDGDEPEPDDTGTPGPPPKGGGTPGKVDTPTSGQDSDPAAPVKSPAADLPGHADGGIFGKEHTARFAEGNKVEAVVPLTKPSRAKEVLSQVVQFFGGNTTEEATTQFMTKLNGFMEKTNAALTRMDSTLLKSSIPAANTNTVHNNQAYDMKSTFNIYDSSGNPQSTAKAVDRQQQLRIRNLQGVLQ